MASLRFDHLFNAATLTRLHPVLRFRLLHPHAAFFGKHDVALGDDAAEVDVAAVSDCLLRHLALVPPQLCETFWCIEEAGSEDNIDRLRDLARQLACELPEGRDLTPSDYAAAVWLIDEKSIHDLLAQRQPLEKRAHYVFMPEQPSSLPLAIVERAERGMTHEVMRWYPANDRGPWARSLVKDDGDSISITFVHGAPYRREGTLVHSGQSAVHFRPLQYTTAWVDRKTGLLQVSASAKGKERKFLVGLIGQHLWLDRAHYSFDRTYYDLEPLRSCERSALACGDVDGLKLVRLASVKFETHVDEQTTLSAPDLMASWDRDSWCFPANSKIRMAKFEFTRSGSPRPFMVSLIDGNRISCAPEHSRIVDRFFAARRFLRTVRRDDRACA